MTRISGEKKQEKEKNITPLGNKMNNKKWCKNLSNFQGAIKVGDNERILNRCLENELSSKKKKLKVVIAGGGTGGHLFPGIAMAQEFREMGAEVAFVGTKKGIEKRVVPREGYPLHFINVRGIKGNSRVKKIVSLLVLPWAFIRSLWLLLKIRPHLVIGVGGYVSGPFVMIASIFRFKTALLEQNTVPGITNKMLARFVKKIFISFPESKKYFPAQKIVEAGNPVRKKIREEINRKAGEKSVKKTKNLLIFGGSQGAHAINMVMQEVLPQLAGCNLEIVHQTGPKDLQQVEKFYGQSQLKSEVLPFIDDMAAAYARADLVLCRAGATTIAELTIAGLPAIFIPFPYATDNHQEYNARSLEKEGAARCMTENELTASKLAELIKNLIEDPAKLKQMSVAMATRANLNATVKIKNELLQMINWSKK
ncbi:MAG: undecaprenyldiphospho-muramoylpentapeptide beta-N-acetylglucosaminyltransferase [Myxococcota bacterium]